MDSYKVVRERDQGLCRTCGRGAGYYLQVHHIIFRSQGGSDEPWNLITLCGECHDRAHGKLTAQLRRRGARTYPKWVLHLIVVGGIRFYQPERIVAEVAQDSRWQVCLSCDRYRQDGTCMVWEEQYQWDYFCSAWRLKRDNV